ncbi:unnamed protein product [Paramecium primaurelia]|uniref:Uncharacterized protein n=1 Tax=Paramecium primaurelia TaxID=5886 RepID=A0A8S1LZE8_PARPR|nr:unnamed protein product [Paramecium primaurelia]
MSQKSKTLLQLLQQQQHFHDDINTSLESNYRHSSEHTEKKFDLKLQKSILDLYSQIKSNILKTEDHLLLCQIRKLVPLDKSEDLYTDPNSLICYIGCIFTVLMQDKLNLEQQVEEQKTRDQSDYEEQLIKLEAEIRQHIRIEQQLKLFAENTQSKLEDALKIKEELEEELQGVKSDFQVLYDKNNTLNQKLRTQEKEIQIIKNNSNNETTNQSLKINQNNQKNQSKKENIENEHPKQQSITINLQIDKQKPPLQDYQDRIQTDPQDDYFKPRNDSHKRIISTHIANTQNNKSNYLATRTQTESYEYQDRKRKNNLSQYETSNVTKHQRNKTAQNVLNLIKDQELKRQQSVKACQDKNQNNQNKIMKKPSNSQHQHVEPNRSNNSVHSFRKQPPEISQIPRPFSCAEQIEESHNSFQKDLSMDMGNYQKQSGDYPDKQQQIKKLLQQYQQKHSLNDTLTKKLLQEYKKRQGYNCKTIY